MRPSAIEYELDSIGLSEEQIRKVMTRLPKESIPLFIENWKKEIHERNTSRTTQNVNPPEYYPRMIPQVTEQRSSEKIENEYQNYSQQRNGINENLDLMATRFFGKPPKNGYTKEYLHKKYKYLAQILHPDKQNNDSAPFQMLRSSYEHLCRKIPESHSALNTKVFEQNNNIIQNAVPPPKNMFGNNNSFDIKSFNSYYEKNSLKDANQEGGYGSWLKEEMNIPINSEKTTNSNFNQVFESSRDKYYKQNPNAVALVEREGPPVDRSYNNSCATLGAGNIEDYSGGSGGVQYADLRKAHEAPHLIVKKPNVRLSSNVKKDFDRALSQNGALPGELSKMELEQLNRIKDAQKEEDAMRQYRLRQFDEDITNHFKKVGRCQLER